MRPFIPVVLAALAITFACGKAVSDEWGSGPVATTTLTGAENHLAATSSLDRFDLDVCTGNQHVLLAGVTVTNVDYLELRESDAHSEPQVSSVGARCFRSRDSGSCLTRLRAVEPFDWKRTGSSSNVFHRGLVTTRGDEVKTISSVSQLVQAVAPLDTPHDAALVVAFGNQGTFRCDGTKNARATDNGWELRVWRTPCGKRVDVETFIRIASNGVIESAHEIEHPTSTENVCL